jgi:hypothetical protein
VLLRGFESGQRTQTGVSYFGAFNEVDSEIAFLELKFFEFMVKREVALQKVKNTRESQQKITERVLGVTLKDELVHLCDVLVKREMKNGRMSKGA